MERQTRELVQSNSGLFSLSSRSLLDSLWGWGSNRTRTSLSEGPPVQSVRPLHACHLPRQATALCVMSRKRVPGAAICFSKTKNLFS